MGEAPDGGGIERVGCASNEEARERSGKDPRGENRRGRWLGRDRDGGVGARRLRGLVVRSRNVRDANVDDAGEARIANAARPGQRGEGDVGVAGICDEHDDGRVEARVVRVPRRGTLNVPTHSASPSANRWAIVMPESTLALPLRDPNGVVRYGTRNPSLRSGPATTLRHSSTRRTARPTP